MNHDRPWADRVLDWLGRGRRTRRDLMREMEELIEEGTAEGVLNEDEEEMLLSVLSFRKRLVREVMVPRTQMACLEIDEPLDALVALMLREGHSRIPVYEDDIDHVVGFIAARDILQYWGNQEPVDLRVIMRPAYFVPETMSLESLLREFRLRRNHLAVAVDEYGGISGLITLEDVLEEIVGDIQDEYDEEELDIRESGDGLRVDATTEIERLEEHLQISFGNDRAFETVGGLVFSVLGHIPQPGETFHYAGLEITVQDADKRRVKEVRIRKLAPRGPESEHSTGQNTS